MPFYIRKSVKAGPFRFNLSKSGVGLSVGVKGLRVGTGPRGHYIHAGRGGLYYRTSIGGSRPSKQKLSSGSTLEPDDLAFHDSGVHMRTIESGDVLGMRDAAFSSVLEEIRAKQRQVKMSIIIGWALGLAGALGAIEIGGNAIILLVLGLPGWALGRWIDSFRRTTVLFYDLESETQDGFKAVTTAFDNIAASQGKWHIVASGKVQAAAWKRNAGASDLVRRKSAKLDYRLPAVIKSNITPPAVLVGTKTIYFFPDVALIEDGNRMGAVGYHDLTLRWADSRFIEEGNVPADAKVVDHTWQYPNKKGGPDKRFKNNRRLPVCLYEKLNLESKNGLNEQLQFSRNGLSAPLAASFSMLKNSAAPEKIKWEIQRPTDGDKSVNLIGRCKCGDAVMFEDYWPNEHEVKCAGCGASVGTYGKIMADAKQFVDNFIKSA